MSLVEWRAALSGYAEKIGARTGVHTAPLTRAEFEKLLARERK